MNPLNPTTIVIELIVIFLSIAIHEFAHCYFADLAGDPTPRYYGRMTLNPLAHFDPVGSLMIIITTISGFGLGWGKPAPMDPRKMRNPRWDFFIAVAAGPISNFLQAAIFAAFIRAVYPGPVIEMPSNPNGAIIIQILVFGVIVNIALGLFNLIPIGPLDGQWLIGLLMPEPARQKFWQFQRKTGIISLVILVVLLDFGVLNIIETPIFSLFHLLTGKFLHI